MGNSPVLAEASDPPRKGMHMYKSFRLLVAVSVLVMGFVSFSSGTVSAGQSTAPTCYRISEYTAESLMAVQTALKVRADGDFGPKSCTALHAFQAKFGKELQVNGAYGTLGDKTAGKLGVTLIKKPGASTTSAKPLPTKSGSGKRIVISKAQNWVWLVDSKGIVVASQGMVFNPSKLPAGTYYVGWKIKKNVVHDGELLLENYMSFFGNIGFHKIPITVATGKRFHDESVLGKGTVRSSGCIRLGSDFSNALWVFAPDGTQVVVV